LEPVDINEDGLKVVKATLMYFRVVIDTLVLASDLTSYVNGALIPVKGGFLSAQPATAVHAS